MKCKNKKVLLRERYTARRVGSARYAALSAEWGGAPSSPDGGGVPHPVLGREYPGLHPHRDLGWDTPCPDLGIRMGVPPSPRKCGQTENITFPHPSDAGGNKVHY